MKSPQNIQIECITSISFEKDFSVAQYCILLFEGNMEFSVDFSSYQSYGKTVICLSPFQHLQIQRTENFEIQLLKFHGDFYCIEYHKKEVACNGLLFNTIYMHPFFQLSENRYQEIRLFFEKIKTEHLQSYLFNDAVLKSYLQLILALCSAEKSELIQKQASFNAKPSEISRFQNLLDQFFVDHKSPQFYAHQMAMSLTNFSKKVKQHFGRTPSILIQERVCLEAKKLLHLTQKSVKEIANELGFEDEFYFSRYFKKNTGISPSYFREQTGVSIVAKISMK